MTTYSIESTNNLLREVPHMLRDFHMESIYNAGDIAFAPVLDVYALMEQSGATFSVVARDSDEEVEAFAVVIVTKHHHDSVMTGVIDLIYVDPLLRKEGMAGKLLACAEEELLGMGVRRTMLGAKLWSKFNPEVYGYTPTEVVHIKHIEE